MFRFDDRSFTFFSDSLFSITICCGRALFTELPVEYRSRDNCIFPDLTEESVDFSSIRLETFPLSLPICAPVAGFALLALNCSSLVAKDFTSGGLENFCSTFLPFIWLFWTLSRIGCWGFILDLEKSSTVGCAEVPIFSFFVENPSDLTRRACNGKSPSSLLGVKTSPTGCSGWALEFSNLFEYESPWGTRWGENDSEHWDCGFSDWGARFPVFFTTPVIAKTAALEVDEFDDEEDEDATDKGELCPEKSSPSLGLEHSVPLCAGSGFASDEGETSRASSFEVEICSSSFTWEGLDFKEE